MILCCPLVSLRVALVLARNAPSTQISASAGYDRTWRGYSGRGGRGIAFNVFLREALSVSVTLISSHGIGSYPAFLSITLYVPVVRVRVVLVSPREVLSSPSR